ncbi:MAG: hypothetical protein HIU57_04305 [Acidobacteria bacterium]|nr:hypothetical protein [Acidobacteriota bacterium]
MSESAGEHEPDVVDIAFSYLDRAMDALHDRVLRPVMLAGRFVAYGFILVLLAVVVLGALVIGVVRFATVYLFAQHIWITYLVVGAISLAIGLVIWRKRRPVPLRKQ